MNNVIWIWSRHSRRTSEKLKQLVNETQDHYELLVDAIQLYKKGKINEKEFFSKIAEVYDSFFCPKFSSS